MNADCPRLQENDRGCGLRGQGQKPPVPVAGARVSSRAALTFRNLSNYVDFCYAWRCVSLCLSSEENVFISLAGSRSFSPKSTLTQCLQDRDNPDMLTQAAEERLAECEDRIGRAGAGGKFPDS